MLGTGLVVRERATGRYWSEDGHWRDSLKDAKRWWRQDDMVLCGRENHWTNCERVWLGTKDRILLVKPLRLVM